MLKRKFDFVPAVFAGFATTALLIGPFPVHAATAAPGAFEVVRPGDEAMTCSALATEIYQLGQEQPTVAAKPKKHGFNILRVVGSVAPVAGMLVPGGMLISAVAGTAQGLASTAGRDRRAGDTPSASPSPAYQRRERLMAISDSKKC